jgi:hypothetical protein
MCGSSPNSPNMTSSAVSNTLDPSKMSNREKWSYAKGMGNDLGSDFRAAPQADSAAAPVSAPLPAAGPPGGGAAQPSTPTPTQMAANIPQMASNIPPVAGGGANVPQPQVSPGGYGVMPAPGTPTPMQAASGGVNALQTSQGDQPATYGGMTSLSPLMAGGFSQRNGGILGQGYAGAQNSGGWNNPGMGQSPYTMNPYINALRG